MAAESPSEPTSRLRRRWAGMGGRLGLGFTVVGFAVIAAAWNGAAGLDYTQGQIPYLLSGGGAGIGLIIVGAALIVTDSSRRDRHAIEERLGDLQVTLARLSAALPALAGGDSSAGDQSSPRLVVAGRRSFHTQQCRLAEGSGRTRMPLTQALDEGLAPCRVCNPY